MRIRSASKATDASLATFAASVLLGLAAGSGIAGGACGPVVTLLALTAWYCAIGRPPDLATWAAAHVVFGLAAAMATGTWLPSAVVGLGGTRSSGVILVLLLAVWHGAIPVGLIGLLSFASRHRHPAIVCAACGLSTWTVELLVSRSGFWIPWVLIGHSQAGSSPLSRLATLGGVPVISAAVVGLATSAGLLLRRRRGARAVATIVWCGAAVFACLEQAPSPDRSAEAVVASRASADPLDVMLVQPNFPRSGRWDPELQDTYAGRIAAFSKRAIDAIETKPDLVIWPENTLTSGARSPDTPSAFARFARDGDVMLIAGLAMPEAARPQSDASERSYRNVLLWYDRKGSTLDRVDKEIGVPGLEARLESSQLEALARFLLGPAYDVPKAVTRRRQGPLQAGYTIAQAVCFEVLFPSLVERRRQEDTRLLINPADDSWTHGEGVSRQLATYASFRAVEQHLPLARVAHGGLTIWYDELGREAESLPPKTYGFLRHEVRPVASLAQRRGIVAGHLAASLFLAVLAAGLMELALPGDHGRSATPIDQADRP